MRHGTRLLQLRHDFGADDGIFVEHDNLYPGEILCRQRSEIGERVVRAHDGADARRCDGHEVEPQRLSIVRIRQPVERQIH